jgi:L-ascorbate metabolism protein UlaG (beta-lactamase superfamily)
MRITWHGHACYHLETARGTSILVDPYLENGKTTKRVGDFDPDVVLLTHGHGDHTGSVLAFRDAHVVSNWEIGAWLEKNGVTERTAMNVGGFARPVPDVRVWMAPALHSSGLDAAALANGTLAYGGSPCGYVVDDGETKLYIAGDTGLFGDMRTVVRDVLAPDAAILPIGDLFTMGPEHAAIAVDWLGVRVATPCHYGTFPPIEQDPDDFARRVGRKAEVRVPKVDEGFEVVGGRAKAAPSR